MGQADIIIRGERPEEAATCAEILRQAFGGDAGASVAKRFRESAEFAKELSVVADRGGKLLGYALYAPTTVTGQLNGQPTTQRAAILATLGVLPAARKHGVGERLVRHGLERCRGLGIQLVFTTAQPAFFARIGFQPCRPYGLEPEVSVPEADFLAIDMQGNLLGRLKGLVQFPDALQP